MRLTVIGCSGSFPGPDSPASCYLLEQEHEGRVWRVLVDLGSGALGALQQYVDPLTVDAVLLSHLHADHCLDLCGFYVMRKYHPDGPRPILPVWGPSGTAGRMARAYDLDEDPGMTAEFDFRTWTPGAEVSIGPFAVEAVRVEHPVEAYGLRVAAGGALLAYTGDSARCPELVRVATGADLLLAEASFHHEADNPPGIHLTGADCGELAGAAGVDRLVITHVPPWFDPTDMLTAAQGAWGGPAELARAGATYEL
ncbi:MBL fold metallo-hydrolase [Nocardioides halotolerans]|uniref:MBL fold metallo-hydrolase n=1 Tax=Nocardioides halotolerans TaxID=433660 RepID=UPI0004048DBA|nr:MBL fold metallo-hydrolase [Nocardioides halotolerans]